MTGKDIYDLAAQLIGVTNADGSDNPDSEDLVSRSCGIINILLSENLPLDRALKGDRTAEAESITALSDAVLCHGLIACAVLPYGLASLLIAGEDAVLSRKLQDCYFLSRNQIMSSVSGRRHEIEDSYRAYAY